MKIGTDHGKGAEPFSDQVVQIPTFEQRVVGGFVGKTGQVMLRGTHCHDGKKRHGDIPQDRPPGSRPKPVKPNRCSNDQCQHQVGSNQVNLVRCVITSPEFLKFSFELGIPQERCCFGR